MTRVEPTRNEDGTLTVPARAEGTRGVHGDGVRTLAPGDPDFAAWDRWMRARDGEGPTR